MTEAELLEIRNRLVATKESLVGGFFAPENSCTTTLLFDCIALLNELDRIRQVVKTWKSTRYYTGSNRQDHDVEDLINNLVSDIISNFRFDKEATKRASIQPKLCIWTPISEVAAHRECDGQVSSTVYMDPYCPGCGKEARLVDS